MMAGLVVVLHVLTVFWLVAGILGRDLTYRQVARTTDLERMRTLIDLGSRFERLMVRPASFAVLLFGLVAAWLRGWPILGFLQGASINWLLASTVIYLSIIPLIVLVFLPRGREFRAALDEAIALGQATPRLSRALHDPAVEVARTYELVMIAVVTWLMVMRPF